MHYNYVSKFVVLSVLVAIFPGFILPFHPVYGSSGQNSKYVFSISNLLSAGKGFAIINDKEDWAWFGARTSYFRAGDINNDGIDDLVTFDTLTTYIYFGKEGEWSNVSLSEADVTIHRNPSVDDFLNVVGIEDVNNDGLNDFMSSALGCPITPCGNPQSHLFFGRDSGDWDANMSALDADVIISAEDDDDLLGHGLDGVGDVNGDGLNDFVISSEFNDQAFTNAGKVYLVLGRETSQWESSSSIHLIANASFLGAVSGGGLGANVAGIGDVNNDGFDDFLLMGNTKLQIGSTLKTVRVNYLVYGRETSQWSSDQPIDDAANLTIRFPSENTEYKVLVKMMAGAGDVNNDGFDDFIMGAYLDDEVDTNTGQVFLVFGRPINQWPASGSIINVSDVANVTFTGDEAGQQAGFSVSGVGDFNNDGFDDVMFSAVDVYGSQPGKAYIVLGRSDDQWVLNNSISDANYTISSENFPQGKNPAFGDDVSGIGDINHDGFFDFSISASMKFDRLGIVYVLFGSDEWDDSLSGPSNENIPYSSSIFVLLAIFFFFTYRWKQKRKFL